MLSRHSMACAQQALSSLCSAGGLPIGATLVTQAVADSMKPGDHGSTFAGSPLVTRAAGTVFDIIRQPEFLQQVCMPVLRLEATTGCLL